MEITFSTLSDIQILMDVDYGLYISWLFDVVVYRLSGRRLPYWQLLNLSFSKSLSMMQMANREMIKRVPFKYYFMAQFITVYLHNLNL